MKIVTFAETGGPEVLRVADVDVPRPAKGELSIRHQAVGVNFIDTYHRSGLYPVTLPSGIGLEAAGVVEAVGEGVTTFAVGDRVAYASGPLGAYAEARVIDAKHVVHLPDGIDAKTAAASLLKGMTTEYLVRRTVQLVAGDWVLLHAAAGGVGLLALQWLSSLGVKVIGTVSTEAKAEVVRAHGGEHVILYTREDFAERTREITGGRGVHAVFDSVGKDTFDKSLACLAPRGTLVCFGNASGKPPMFDPMRLAAGSLFLTRAVLAHYIATRPELEASSAAYFDVVRDGRVKVLPPKEIALVDAADAHRALAGRETIGSTILLP